MFRLAVVAVALLALAEARPRANYYANVDAPFIVGGSPAAKGRWPWQLSLQICTFGCGHTCGAVLISANKALTAAHCTINRSGFQVLVGAGQIDGSDAEQAIEVASTTEHPGYSGSAPGIPNDIATMALSESARTVSGIVEFASLASVGSDWVGSTCYISGWGRTSGDGGSLPTGLREALVDHIDTAECQNRMPINLADGVTDSHFCVHTSTGTRGSCQGDSGGPVQCGSAGSWTVCGVTSWGVGNIFNSCDTTYPSVYTRVSAYRDWISSN